LYQLKARHIRHKCQLKQKRYLFPFMINTLNISPDITASGKSKMAAVKPEVLGSQFLQKISTSFLDPENMG